MVVIGLSANIAAPCLTSIAAEFGLREGRSGAFLGSMFWGVVVSLLATGPVADRIGFRAPLIVGSLLQAAGLFWVSASHAFHGACLGAFLAGLGVGVTDALATPLACALYREQRTRVANVLHAFYPVGLILVLLLAFCLLGRPLSWRGLYRLIGLLCLPPAVIFCFPALPAHAHEGEERLTVRRLARSPVFWLLGALLFLACMCELGPVQWLPAFIEKLARPPASADPMPARRLGMLGMLVYGLAMTAGRAASAWGARRLRVPALLALGSAVVAAGLLLAAAFPSPGPAIVFLSLSGLGVACLWPTILALAGDRFPQAGASMFALLPVMGNLGGVVGPLTIGVVAEAAGLRAGMAVLAAAPLSIILLVRRLSR